ncbi:hypothetical protein Ddye_031485 [Dipteronia dyeriana]|uniref:WAT1-related protein n=1 Tax=Dipteronia dyeriana TaxID=168575 RepID=A0AAD9WNQ2_9ROSI|nr:hypothetical protein Ddye_031485 [Dipteronia dyeriana]
MDSSDAVKKWMAWSEVFISMIMVQVFATGMQLLSKVILNQGTFIFALLTYRHVVAALCVSPFAFCFERGLSKKYTWSLLFWLFINALTGMTGAMGLYYYGLRDTTATYAINFLNLIPIFTFIFSIILRIEKLKLDTIEGKFKTLGAILCVGGALTTSLYKGKDIIHFGHPKIHHNSTVNISQRHHWTRGTFMLVGSVMSYASWYMVQVKLLKIFPFKFTLTMLTCMVTSLQSAVIGLFIDTSKVSWTLGWNLQLITIVYSGALATAATFCLITRVIPKRGPTYPPMFNPLALIFTAFFEALIFGQAITLGSLLGSFFIMLGLYAFLWAKKKEYKKFQAQAQAQANVQVTVVGDEG